MFKINKTTPTKQHSAPQRNDGMPADCKPRLIVCSPLVFAFTAFVKSTVCLSSAERSCIVKNDAFICPHLGHTSSTFQCFKME